MTEHNEHNRAVYSCVDKNPEAITGLQANTYSAMFYFVQARCNHTGHCPPYIDGAEITCVVCTRQ